MPLPRDMTSQLSENNTPVISLNACRLAGIPSEPLFSVKALLLHHQHTFCDLKLYKINCPLQYFGHGVLFHGSAKLKVMPPFSTQAVVKILLSFMGLQCCRITVYKYFRIEFPSFIWERLLLTRVAAKQLSALSWLDYAKYSNSKHLCCSYIFFLTFFHFYHSFYSHNVLQSKWQCVLH